MKNKNQEVESGSSAPRREAFAASANLSQKVELLSSFSLVQMLVIDGMADPNKEGFFDNEREAMYSFLDFCRAAIINGDMGIKY